MLLKVGYRLTPAAIARLAELGVYSLWVQYPSLAFLSRVIRPDIIASQGELVTRISGAFEDLQRQSVARMSFATYTSSIRELIEGLVGNPQAAVFLGDLVQAGGDDLMRHSSTVTYLSLLLGLKLEGYLIRQRRHIDPARAKEVVNLGVGAMLHDIGITQLPADARERYRKTGDESDPAWREHPTLGYQMTRGKLEPTAATVILNHHQRFDGSGYAGKAAPPLDGQRIHIFSRIVGVAEQFDRLRNPARLPAQPTAWALAAFLQPALLAKFDPEVVRALLTVVPPYPPGTMVRLSDGRWAVAIDHSPEDPCRPTVQVIPDPSRLSAEENEPAGVTIRLAEEPAALFVAQADGQDVSELNFPRPALMQLHEV
jgi:HD-GYP domain-containing protein (c-di-GMP phosphodiesterase class II)